MPTERIQRQIDRLLDEAEAAVALRDWVSVRTAAQDALDLDPENGDAAALVGAAERALARAENVAVVPDGSDHRGAVSAAATEMKPDSPASFANGRYAVNRFLGEGGKKKVYLAHDTLLDRDVAFALIKTEGLDEQARARITREAQAMGRLGDHPNIVTIHDIGQEADQPYLVLPLMPGGDVAGLIEKAENHQLPLEQAIAITDQLCRALEHAHSKEIIHRDVKPGNVWLTADGTAKLGDFGLAVAIDRSRLTQAGMMVGTVSYMPPEQALGGEITARSDLYSVGCMLYEMVTGRPPFVGDDNIAIIGQHLNTPPVAPSWHRPDLPRGFEALILRLLEKDPNKRPASANETRQALVGIDLSLTPSHPSPTGGEGAPVENPLYRRTFVGREAELRQLQSAFDGAMSGQGALAMVVGEPGIGKTALVEQLGTYVSLRGGRTLVGHCYEEGSLSLPYLAFVEAMRSYVLAREPEALKSDLGTGAADVARIVSEIRDRVQVELRPQGDPEDDRWRLFQSVTSFLRNASQVQPLLIVLEDLHWADRGTLDLLVHVVRNLQGARLLVVGTYRDVEVDRSHPLSGALADLSRIASFSRVRLRGLTAEEVQRMLSGQLTQDVGWALAEAVHRQTEGNPLFVQEVVRYLAEEGLIAREGTRWRRTGDQPLSMAIPEGLRDVIGKRLSRLSADTNRLLSIAAVVGRDFSLTTLSGVAASDEEGLLASLDEAVKVGVLEERSQVGGVQYRFAHAFFRQTLYEELGAARRIRLHQQVGRALEEQYKTRVSEHAAELAEHFSHSSDPVDLARAVEYGELAAQRAMAVFDYGEVARLLERALDVQEVLDPDDKAKRCDLVLALGESLIPAGEPLRVAEEVAAEALSIAEALGDENRAARVCQLALAALFRWGGAAAVAGTPSLGRWAHQADRYAATGTVARVYADLALSQVARGREEWAKVWEQGMQALEAARKLDNNEALFFAAGLLLSAPHAPGHQEVQRELALEFLERPRGSVSVSTMGEVLARCSGVLLAFGERDTAEKSWNELRELAERTRDPYLLLTARFRESQGKLLDGRLEAALDEAGQVATLGVELGSAVAGQNRADNLSRWPLVYLGRSEEALAVIGRAREMAGSEQQSTVTLASRLLFLAHLGRLEESRALLHRVVRERSIGPEEDGNVHVITLAYLLDASVLTEDHETASILFQRFRGLPPMSLVYGGPIGMTCPARLLGAAAALLGKPEVARAYYQQALELSTKIRFRPEIALTRLQLAELLLEHYSDERAEALEHLDFAIGEFREMKMRPSLERALRHRGLLKA